MMSEQEYNKAMDAALTYAHCGLGWNKRYIVGLERHGLKLIPQPSKLPTELRRFCTCPLPMEGDEQPFEYPSLIVPKDFITASEIEAFLRRKYVVRRNRGIDYMEAAVDDLARELERFCAGRL